MQNNSSGKDIIEDPKTQPRNLTKDTYMMSGSTLDGSGLWTDLGSAMDGSTSSGFSLSTTTVNVLRSIQSAYYLISFITASQLNVFVTFIIVCLKLHHEGAVAFQRCTTEVVPKSGLLTTTPSNHLIFSCYILVAADLSCKHKSWPDIVSCSHSNIQILDNFTERELSNQPLPSDSPLNIIRMGSGVAWLHTKGISHQFKLELRAIARSTRTFEPNFKFTHALTELCCTCIPVALIDVCWPHRVIRAR